MLLEFPSLHLSPHGVTDGNHHEKASNETG